MNTEKVVSKMMNGPRFKVRRNAVPDDTTIKAGNRFAARYARELGYEETRSVTGNPDMTNEVYLGPKPAAKVSSVALTHEEFDKLQNLYREQRVDTFYVLQSQG